MYYIIVPLSVEDENITLFSIAKLIFKNKAFQKVQLIHRCYSIFVLIFFSAFLEIIET